MIQQVAECVVYSAPLPAQAELPVPDVAGRLPERACPERVEPLARPLGFLQRVALWLRAEPVSRTSIPTGYADLENHAHPSP